MAHKIEWLNRPGTVGETWSPVTGCTPISEGCAHCWARRMAKRLAGRFGYPADDPFAVTLHPDKLYVPYHWQKPRTVFVCSMGDLFHEVVPGRYIERVFDVTAQTPRHTYLILTRRPDRAFEWCCNTGRMPRPNIWLGVTAENQEQADRRIPVLLQIPAAVHFVSIEPMLGPVALHPYIMHQRDRAPGEVGPISDYGPALSWVIVGGESGPGARPLHPRWARDVRYQCIDAGVPFFFKQWGKWLPIARASSNWTTDQLHKYQVFDDTVYAKVGKARAGHLLDGQEWHQWPVLL